MSQTMHDGGKYRILAFPLQRLAHLAPGRSPQWRSAAEPLWPAWQALAQWEETSATELGLPFGELVVLLWSVHRFGGSDAGLLIIEELLDRLPEGCCDPLLEDVAECAFALGAGWAESRHSAAG